MTKHEQTTIKLHGIKPFAEAVAELLDEMNAVVEYRNEDTCIITYRRTTPFRADKKGEGFPVFRKYKKRQQEDGRTVWTEVTTATMNKEVGTHCTQTLESD